MEGTETGLVVSDQPSDANDWQDRFVERLHVDPETLIAHPLNYRVHPRTQHNAVEGSLDELGWFDEVKAQHGTGVVIDGHLRVLLAVSKREQTIPVAFYAMSDDEVALALGVKDASAAMADVDTGVLESLLDAIPQQSGGLQRLFDDLRREHDLFRPTFPNTDEAQADLPGMTAGSGARAGATAEAELEDGPETVRCPHCGEEIVIP